MALGSSTAVGDGQNHKVMMNGNRTPTPETTNGVLALEARQEESTSIQEEHGSRCKQASVLSGSPCQGSHCVEKMRPTLHIAPLPGRLRMTLPPRNFGTVEKGCIYRSGYPEEENYAFFKSFKLATILTLVPEPLSPGYKKFIHENKIKHIQIHIPANKDGEIKITPQRMSIALSHVLDRSNYPMLIHCNRGKHRTGCVVACFRKIQSMATREAISEYRDYASPKCRDEDIAFIDSYDPFALLPYAFSQGWTIMPPPERSEGSAVVFKKDSVIFSLEDMAACKCPEDADSSL